MWKTLLLSRLKGSLTQSKLQFSFRSMKEKSKGSCWAQRASLRRQCLHWMTSLKLDAPLTAIIPDVLASFTLPLSPCDAPLHQTIWMLAAAGVQGCSQMCKSKSETALLSGIHKNEKRVTSLNLKICYFFQFFTHFTNTLKRPALSVIIRTLRVNWFFNHWTKKKLWQIVYGIKNRLTILN